jgi:hypothetical protein
VKKTADEERRVVDTDIAGTAHFGPFIRAGRRRKDAYGGSSIESDAIDATGRHVCDYLA